MEKVLISGASVAGPVLAYWLRQYGFEPTIVERTPALRHGLGVMQSTSSVPASRSPGGWGWDEIHQARTRTRMMTIERPGRPPLEADIERMTAGISDQHVEILRGELTKILYEATRRRWSTSSGLDRVDP